jgi:hypothetical protein
MGWSSRLVQQRLRETFAVERLPAAERSPVAVQRANEARGWLAWVDEAAARYLAAQALCADRGLPIRSLLRARGWPRTSFYRSVDEAASRIAAELTARGVAPG